MSACAEPYGVSRSAGASRRCRPWYSAASESRRPGASASVRSSQARQRRKRLRHGDATTPNSGVTHGVVAEANRAARPGAFETTDRRAPSVPCESVPKSRCSVGSKYGFEVNGSDLQATLPLQPGAKQHPEIPGTLRSTVESPPLLAAPLYAREHGCSPQGISARHPLTLIGCPARTPESESRRARLAFATWSVRSSLAR